MRIILLAGVASIILDMVFDKENRSIAWIEGFSIIMASLIVTCV